MSITCKIGKKELPAASVLQTSGFLRGQEREQVQLFFHTAKVTYKELYALLQKPENCKKIILTDNSAPENKEALASTKVFENYMVPGEPLIAVTKMAIGAEARELEEVFVVTLGKLTFIEEKLLQMGIDTEKE